MAAKEKTKERRIVADLAVQIYTEPSAQKLTPEGADMAYMIDCQAQQSGQPDNK